MGFLGVCGIWAPAALLSSLGPGVIDGKGFEITELGVFFLFTVRRSMISVRVKELVAFFKTFPLRLGFAVFPFVHLLLVHPEAQWKRL